jgi:hypothetical protein
MSVVSVLASLILLGASGPGYSSGFRSIQLNASQTPGFKLLTMGNGRTRDGVPTYFSNYESSGGNKLYKILIEFQSTERCNEQLNALIKASVKLIERGPRKDRDGHTVGERIVVLLPTKLPDERLAAIAWTNGKKYTDIRSNSLEDLQAFEKGVRETPSADASH